MSTVMPTTLPNQNVYLCPKIQSFKQQQQKEAKARGLQIQHQLGLHS